MLALLECLAFIIFLFVCLDYIVNTNIHYPLQCASPPWGDLPLKSAESCKICDFTSGASRVTTRFGQSITKSVTSAGSSGEFLPGECRKN